MISKRINSIWRAALFGVLLASSGAHAATLFTSSLDLPGNGADASDSHPFASVLDDSVSLVNGIEADAAAVARFGRLGARARFSIPDHEVGVPGLGSSSAGASAGVRFDDIIFTRIDNPADHTPIAVSTNFFLDGFFELSNGSDDTRASAGVSVNYGLGTGLANAVTTIGGINRTRDRGTLNASNSGVFQNAGLGDDMSIHGSFVSTTLLVPVGVAVPLSLRIIVGSNGASRDGASVGAATNFMDTLFLVLDGPVFNLPAGYTANSVSAQIINNQVNNQVQAVPLPSSVVMLASALMLVALRRRHALG